MVNNEVLQKFKFYLNSLSKKKYNKEQKKT